MGVHDSPPSRECLGRSRLFGSWIKLCLGTLVTGGTLAASRDTAAQQEATPGYPEQVLQWTVQPGETCDSLAEALYGSRKHKQLLLRYNYLVCGPGEYLVPGTTLVVPAAVVELPAARVDSLQPDVRAKAPGSTWQPASSGMPLYRHHVVNTLQEARASILFVDRTRVSLSEHTLVVIYGTAEDSTVTSEAPPVVELESGEVQAGLAALRGPPARVSVKSGGEVKARSSDTVVRTRDTKTTVSVFDGDAEVKSAGKTVHVPVHHGSLFHAKMPPADPRPLPPAPVWAEPTSTGLVFAPRGASVIEAHWQPVAQAKAYRVELSRDAEFRSLVVREEAPSSIVAFRGEKLPAGTYWMRVRAIDGDDFLGLAAAPRTLHLVTADFPVSPGSVESGVIETSAYGVLEFDAPGDLELSLDGGAFGPVPRAIDLQRQAPQRLAVRPKGSDSVSTFDVKYRPLRAEIRVADPGQGDRAVEVRLGPVATEAEAQRIAPRLRVLRGDAWSELPLEPTATLGVWHGLIPQAGEVPSRVTLVDGRGRLLGSMIPEAPPVLAARVVPPKPPRYTDGVCAPLVVPAPLQNGIWAAPTACNAASLNVAMVHAPGKNGLQGTALASGAWGIFGFDGRLATEDLNGGRPFDDAAWLGLRWRAWERAERWSFGPSIRAGLPATRSSAPLRLETSLALAWQGEGLAWITNAGVRNPLGSDSNRLDTHEGQGLVATGATWNALEWLLLFTTVDAEAGRDAEQASWVGRAGLTLGLETRTPVFVGLSTRLSPFEDEADGRVTTQAALGVRGD